MRVAFTTLAPFISGAERSLQVTLRHLPAVGVAPLVIGPPEAKIAAWCQREGVPFFAAPLPFRDKWHPLRWWLGVRRLRTLLRQQGVDVLHSNQIWSYPAAGAAGRDLGLPRLCHLRDDASPETLRWCCAAGVEAAVCISRHITRQAEAAWPPGPGRPLLETWLNPIELPVRVPEAEHARRRAEARKALDIPDGVTVFGFIGQVREVKGLLGLLDVVAQLPTGRPWRLLVAGRDPTPGAAYERLCRERAARSDLAGRVRFLGFLEDTSPFYQAIDLAVIPSLEEPLGRVPLEAAAYSRPSIAFDVGGLPDTIRHGETGWLVPAADWSALASSLRRFLEQPEPERGAEARRWVEQAADPNQYAHRLVTLYRLLSKRTQPPTNPTNHRMPCALS